MPRRKRKASAAAVIDADTLRKLSECGTRTGLNNALEHLAVAGWLKPSVARQLEHGTKRRIEKAVQDHARADTPYGPVMQSMAMPITKLKRWAFAHPLALLFHLALISTAFADMMESCVTPGVPLRVVIYIDEICPGNPLRPEKSRTLQAIYWALADWPQWVLQRTAAWPCFGTIRSTVVKEMPGNIPQLMKMVLKTFFPEDGDSFARGVTIHVKQTAVVVHGVFAGFIADEKAHKELSSTKGASGSKPCVNCHNVFKGVAAAALMLGAVTIACADPSQFQPMTNELVYAFNDRLSTLSPQERKIEEQLTGIKFEPHGLLNDPHIRTFYKPIDHMLRDWQHTVVGGGVANTEMARVIAALGDHGIPLTMLQDWLQKFVLPRQYGKVDPRWLTKKRLGKKSLSLQSFAGVMLNIVPIVATFMSEVVEPAGHPLSEHLQCLWRLHLIIGILKLGPEEAMPRVERLRCLIREHAELFTKLYPGHVKPKFHHLFHIVDNMIFLGALLSCFVCERKHRFTKKAALHVFRSIDNTVVKEMLSRQCEAIRHGGESLFKKQFLSRPKTLNFAGTILHRASTACLPCGSVSEGDLVWSRSGDSVVVGRVLGFWQHHDSQHISVQLSGYSRVDESINRFDTSVCRPGFVDASNLIDTLAYAKLDDGVLLVIPPPSEL
jgi:hypothetical protein